MLSKVQWWKIMVGGKIGSTQLFWRESVKFNTRPLVKGTHRGQYYFWGTAVFLMSADEWRVRTRYWLPLLYSQVLVTCGWNAILSPQDDSSCILHNGLLFWFVLLLQQCYENHSLTETRTQEAWFKVKSDNHFTMRELCCIAAVTGENYDYTLSPPSLQHKRAYA
jgi:hypothetical protein